MNSNSNHYQKDEVKNTSSSRDGSPNHQQNANADKLDKSRPSAVSDVASPPQSHENNPSTDSVQSDINSVIKHLEAFSQGSEEANKKSKLTPLDFKWLKGEGNERAIFWVWILLRELPLTNNLYFIRTRQENASEGARISSDTILYEYFGLPNETGSTRERSHSIIKFFYTLENHSNSVDARGLLERIRTIWMNFIYPVRNVVWLNKKNESELDEIWDYLLKKKELSDCILNWFKPVDNNERRLAIIGAIDSLCLFYDVRDVFIKKDIFVSAYKNALQNRRREKNATGNKKAGLNAEISQKSKNALVKMAETKGVRINKLIEKIILDEYSRFNSKD